MSSRVNADTRRKQVVAHAAELFDKAGYHATNMTQLARGVGLKKPTLYNYFAAKNEILFWIHEEFIDLLISKSEARSGDDFSPTAQLRLVMADILELMDTHRGHVRVFFEHHRELSVEQQEAIRTKRDQYHLSVKGIVQAGIRAGEFRDLEPSLVTLALFGTCNWAYQWYQNDGAYASEQISEFFFDLLFEGLKARRDSRSGQSPETVL